MSDEQELTAVQQEVADLRVRMGEIRTLETAQLLDRLRWATEHGLTFGGQRSEYNILGYDHIITYRQYRAEYDRGGIAARVVDVMPDACWRGDPSFEIIEDEDPKKNTEFEQAFKKIAVKHKLPSIFHRVDKLAGLSTYAVLLIGAEGEQDQPLPTGNGNPDKLLYVMPFSGGGGPGPTTSTHQRSSDTGAKASVFEYEDNPKSPRFGLPRFYKLNRTGANSDFLVKPVHWTRIVHIAEGLLEDDVFGLPRLERIWNLLADLRKVTGGGAEAFWLRANQGMQMDLDKDMALSDVDGSLAKLKEQAEAYQHQLTRWIRTRGVKMNVLGSDVANFANPADAIITQIAGARAIPKRILTGSEMGELASSQDRENFKDQINGRQVQFCAPMIVRQLVDRLVEFGYLPTPKKGPLEYQVKWPHIQVLTEQEKSDGALKWSQTKVGEDPVFVDAEIRDKWYAMPPLTEEQREEINQRKEEAVARQQQAMAANQPLKAKDEEDEEELRAAQDAELLPVLAAAIAAGDVNVVHRILGIESTSSQPPDKWQEAFKELALKVAGGPGSGNFGHAGRPGEVGGSAPEGGGAASTTDKRAAQQKFRELKAEWAHKNNDLFKFIDHPDSPEAKAHLNEMKALVKEMHTLDADPGGIEGLGLPGGPRDLVIVGGGPGGLSASINGSLEGYDTLLIEAQEQVGGQARQSTRIENLPGFPLGVSGERLSRSMEEQAERVGSEHKLGVKVTGIEYDPETNLKTLTLSNGERIEARAVILSGGLSHVNRAPWDAAGSPDVSYGNPEKILKDAPDHNVVIAGGSNGAAQAAIACAENGAKNVTLISRSELEKSMSDYQLNQVRNHPRITPIVADIRGRTGSTMTLSDGRTVAAEKVGVFYGNAPDTKWLPPSIETAKGRVVTSHTHNFETSMPGVFAVGDITHNGAGRIGVAIGEGQSAVKELHQYFEAWKAKQRLPRAAEGFKTLAVRRRKSAGDIRVWNAIVDQGFALDNEQPWYGQTVEGEKLPRKPTHLSKNGERKIRHAEHAMVRLTEIFRSLFDPDQPRDESGKWTSGGGNRTPEGAGSLPLSGPLSVKGPANANPRAELPEQSSTLRDDGYESIEDPISLNVDDEEELGDSHLNTVLKLTTENGEEVVFKPTDGEKFRSGFSDDGDNREWIREDITNTDATLAEREVLAYRVDRELGLGLVPRTVYGEYQGREGAASTFVNEADELYGSKFQDSPENTRMGILDAVIGNQDRHSQNALVDANDHVVAIDHGFSFGSTPPGGYIRSWALAGMNEGTLSVAEQVRLAQKLTTFDFDKVLKGAHLDERERETFKERVAVVAERLRAGEAHLIKTDFDVTGW